MSFILHIGLSLLCLNFFSCNTSARKPVAREPISCTGTDQILHELSIKKTEIIFPVSFDAMKRVKQTVSIQLKQVINPGKVPVMIRLFFSDPGNSWPIGNFSLYPPNDPGLFKIRINEKIKEISNDNKIQSGSLLNFIISLDSTVLKNEKRSDRDALLIKICDPVFN